MEKERHTETVLTSSVFETSDGGGSETNTAKKTSSFLLVNLSIVPDTDRDRISSTEKAGNKRKERPGETSIESQH